jgi:hypothetical protein
VREYVCLDELIYLVIYYNKSTKKDFKTKMKIDRNGTIH